MSAECGKSLARELAGLLSPATVVVCVGSELHGDDGAALAVAESLAGELPWTVFNAATAPESFIGKIAAAAPDVVVLVDATDFGGSPGGVALIPAERIVGQGPSTHGPSPRMFLQALLAIHPCRCFVLGIQPLSTEVGAPLSEPVRQAVRDVAAAFRAAARKTSPR